MRLYDDAGQADVSVGVRDWMKAYGGSFQARLAGLYEVADQYNRNKLVSAFYPLFQEALDHALDWKAQEAKLNR